MSIEHTHTYKTTYWTTRAYAYKVRMDYVLKCVYATVLRIPLRTRDTSTPHPLTTVTHNNENI